MTTEFTFDAVETVRMTFVALEPGNGWRYELAAGWTPGGWDGMGDRGGILVAWRRNGAAMLDAEGPLSSGYIREKLGGSECDASAITLWLCQLFPRRAPIILCGCPIHADAS